MSNKALIDALGDLVVADLLTVDPITAAPDTPMKEIIKIFRDKGYQGIPIVDDGILQGMATKRDLLEIYFIPHHEVDDTEKLFRLSSLLDPSKPVREFMDLNPITVTPACKASRLAKHMVENDTFTFPVIRKRRGLLHKGKGEMVGIVTLTDIMPLLYEAILRKE